MFKNNDLINTITDAILFKKYLYQKLIFNKLVKTFLKFCFLFFIIIFSVSFINLKENLNIFIDILNVLCTTTKIITNNINIILIICFIYLFFYTKKSFNITILESFGATNRKILKPMIYFLFIVSLTNILILKPLSIELENFKNIKILEKNSNQIKEGFELKIIDRQNTNNYKIVLGNYKTHNAFSIILNKAMIIEYKNNTPLKTYKSDKLIMQNSYYQMDNVEVLNIPNNSIYSQNSLKIQSNLSVEEVILHTLKDNKINKHIKLSIYDYIAMFKYYDISKEQNVIYKKLRLYFINETINLFNAILCCFLTYFVFICIRRNRNFFLKSFICFIFYFIILRFFHFLDIIKDISVISSLCVCGLSFILCLFMYYLILSKYWLKI